MAMNEAKSTTIGEVGSGGDRGKEKKRERGNGQVLVIASRVLASTEALTAYRLLISLSKILPHSEDNAITSNASLCFTSNMSS